MKSEALHIPLAQSSGHCLRREAAVDEIYIIASRIPTKLRKNVECLDSIAYYYCFDLILREPSVYSRRFYVSTKHLYSCS